MNEKTILLTNIKPNDYNPNEMMDAEFAELVQEIKHLGKPPKPIVLRNKGEFFEIVDGEHSYKALKELGINELKQDWYELVDFDDIEAKRQTYKRNLGGKNNPIKLGLMIAQALEESKLSNRKLAEQWEVSEGMIRNYLQYAEVGKLRNDYANLAKCSVEQIRTYLKIAEYAKPIADFWFSCGGLKDALLVLDDDIPFEKANYDVMTTFHKLCEKIMKHNYYKVLPLKHSQNRIPFDLTPKDKENYIKEFKASFNRALNIPKILEKMVKYFIWDENVTPEYMLEYLALYYDIPRTIPGHWVQTTFSMVIRKVDNKYEFMLTPDEIKECMQYEYDEEGFNVIRERLKLIIKRKFNIPTYEIKESSEPLETMLDRLEVETTAPDYVKKFSAFPLSLKRIFLEMQFGTDEARKEAWEILTTIYNKKDFEKINLSNKENVQEKINSMITEVKQKELKKKEQATLINKSEQELAQVFVEKLNKLFKGNEKVKKTLSEKMVKTFSKDFLHLFVYLANKYYDEREWQEQYKALVTEAREAMKSNK